ncbi:outer membrane lipoprotein chaperone LolA [Candidatus Fukatsuia anoeciicola]|uniref:outer membrane lipoprotein chaperone LolA n=1 Tax=Candidatus Fukatsuia anoeciicola TaxID=2994492 RepID=UPI003464450A
MNILYIIQKLYIWFLGIIFFLYTLVIIPIFAMTTQDLQIRLNKITSFHATFSQQITSAEGTIMQHGKGELWIKRPNFFNCQMILPDKNVLISDGENLWFYNPFIEQVTVNWLKDTINNTPFMLIIRNNSSDWQQYNIKQQNDNFKLIPKTPNSNLKQFKITVTANGVIKTFSIIEQDGQQNTYFFKEQSNNNINTNKFKFNLPKSATLDDQRQ